MRHIIHSTHALSRQQQRGISSSMVETIIEYADLNVYCRDNCQRIWVSHQLTASLVAEGILTAQESERVPHIRVVIADDGTIVTEYRESHRRRRAGRSQGGARRRRRRC